MECSAKSGQSVHEVFATLTRMMKEKFIDEKLKESEEEDPDDDNNKKGVVHLIKSSGRNIHNKCCQNQNWFYVILDIWYFYSFIFGNSYRRNTKSKLITKFSRLVVLVKSWAILLHLALTLSWTIQLLLQLSSLEYLGSHTLLQARLQLCQALFSWVSLENFIARHLPVLCCPPWHLKKLYLYFLRWDQGRLLDP